MIAQKAKGQLHRLAEGADVGAQEKKGRETLHQIAKLFDWSHTSISGILAETINGMYMAEVIYRRSWPTGESPELATLQWVVWFSHRQLLGPIGYIPPAEAEANQCRQLASQASTVAA